MTEEPTGAPRVRVMLVVAVGVAAALLAGLVAHPPDTAYGQTGPQRPTSVVDRPSTPLATPAPGTSLVAATVVVPTPPPTAVTLAPQSFAANAPAIAVPTLVVGGSATNAPAPLGGASPAAPLSEGTGGNDSASAPFLALPTPVVGPPRPASGGPLVSAVIPATSDPTTDALAIVSTADGASVRVSVFAPPRADGPLRIAVGSPDPGVVGAISLPGVVISRAFSVDATGPDGSRIANHTRPLTIVVGYTETDLAFAGGDPRQLHVLRWDPDQRVALVLDTLVDLTARTLSAATDHTSLFLLGAVQPGTSGSVAARPRAAWGSTTIAPAAIPSAMPRVGGEPRPGASDPADAATRVVLLAALALAALGATLAAPSTRR